MNLKVSHFLWNFDDVIYLIKYSQKNNKDVLNSKAYAIKHSIDKSQESFQTIDNNSVSQTNDENHQVPK